MTGTDQRAALSACAPSAAAQCLSGLFFVACPGLGLIAAPPCGDKPFPPCDEMQHRILGVWQTAADDLGLGISLGFSYFFLFIGCCKAIAAPAIWGAFGPGFELLANLCLVPQLAGAAYTHHVLGEPLRPPCMVCSMAVRNTI